MFLSDQLIEIGQNANPKSNISMGDQSKKMHDLLIEKLKEGEDMNKLVSITKHACKKLNEKGFSLYRVELFFETKKG